MLKRFRLAALVLTLSLTIVVMAQGDDCPALVEQALNSVDEFCSGIERNEACYGNIDVDAEPQPDVSNFRFNEPGDIEDIEHISSLSLSGMNTPDEWGVMLMSVQANLPDSLPGQNITMLLFGEVTLGDRRMAELPQVEMKIRKNGRVRSGPGTEFQQIGSVRNGDVVMADARNEAATWVRIVLEDGSRGWVLADVTTARGPVSSLVVLNDDLDADRIDYAPMQAFYFSSGVGDAQCNEAPLDGMLIQTPEGAGEIELVINEAKVQVGSTIFLRAIPGEFLRIAVLAGEIRVTVAGQTVIAPAGTEVVIPLNREGVVDGPPELEVYDEDDVAALPVGVLPERVRIAAPLSPSELEEVLVRNRTPLSGDWRLLSASCGERLGEIIPIEFAVDGTELTMIFFGSTLEFDQVEGGTYSDGVRVLYVLSPDYIESQNTVNSCSISLQRVG